LIIIKSSVQLAGRYDHCMAALEQKYFKAPFIAKIE